MEKHEAEALLKLAVAYPHARFHAGQWKAIDALVNHRQKLMVVQRTGWGKSSVQEKVTAGPMPRTSTLIKTFSTQAGASKDPVITSMISTSNQPVTA